MKKSFLLSVALAATCSAFAAAPAIQKADKQIFNVGPKAQAPATMMPTRSDKYINFTYAEEVYSQLGLNNTTPGKTRAYMAFMMAPEDIKAYAGCSVTGFSVYSPTNNPQTANTITEGRFFITTDFTKEDQSQDFKMQAKPYALNQITLDAPYTITGEEETLVFGYSVIVKADMYYIPVDGVAASEDVGICCATDEDSFPTIENWMTFGSYYGALCMSLRLEGETLPENIATIPLVDTLPYIPLSGEGANLDFLVKNAGANELSSIEVTASVTGMPDMVQNFEFAPLAYGEMNVLTLTGLKANTPAFVDFSMKITKVNGIEFDGSAYTVTVPAYENGYLKKIVAEDATGTWCGWCPGGIEALDYLKTNYPDRAIAIGVHVSQSMSNRDPMEISEYLPFVNAYVEGFPCVWYNRTIDQTPTDTYDNVCKYVDQVVAFFDFPAYAQVSLEGKSNEDGTASVTASTEFSISTTVTHYLSFVIVEDGVGPYYQTNYFPQQKIAMNGWEKQSGKVSMLYDDVARYYDSYPGIKGSVPSSIEANVVNQYSVELPLTRVKGDKFRVIALLTNAKTGEIVNATEYEMEKAGSTAVEGISSDDNAPVEYYNLNGQKISDPSNGIFIRRQGTTTTKVAIP